MNFYSTNNRAYQVGLEEAVIKGLAPDQGLFMPTYVPILSDSFYREIHEKSFQEIGSTVLEALFSEDLTSEQLDELVQHTLAFDAPLVEIQEGIFSLELYHGPTLAFKDFGARFCSKLMSFFRKRNDQKIHVLVATSGDTGSAVANGFLGVEGVEVIVLYPKGKVSELQEKQFTTLGQNVTAIEIEGVFDDCQKLVKDAFLDKDLSQRLVLTSANSINVARWIPQSLYYFHAFAQLPVNGAKTAVSVPSGNFGNLAAGILAAKMGLPIDKFIASTNVNKVVPDFLEGNVFKAKPSLSTISNSMDVGNPSNFNRLLAMFDSNESKLRDTIRGFYFDDVDTARAMRWVHENAGYILDPHGAVGYLGLRNFLKQTNESYNGIFLHTAHPGKFKAAVDKVLGIDLELPGRLEKFLHGTKVVTEMPNDFNAFKTWLLQKV